MSRSTVCLQAVSCLSLCRCTTAHRYTCDCQKRKHSEPQLGRCLATISLHSTWLQDMPKLEKQAKWSGKPSPSDNKWDATIKEAVERGKEVPEIDWAEPGEAAATKVRMREACCVPIGAKLGQSVLACGIAWVMTAKHV